MAPNTKHTNCREGDGGHRSSAQCWLLPACLSPHCHQHFPVTFCHVYFCPESIILSRGYFNMLLPSYQFLTRIILTFPLFYLV